MAKNPVYIGLDVGTSAVKALLVSEEGHVVARGSHRVSLRHVGSNGVEQDMQEINRAVVAAVRQIADAADVANARGIGVTAQGGAMQLLDAEGKCLGGLISWMDHRDSEYRRRFLKEATAAWLNEHTGGGSTGIAVGQILRLREEEPAVMRRASRIGFAGDEVVRMMTGRGAMDPTSLSIAGLCNPRIGRLDQELLRRLGLEADLFPAVMDACEPAGTLRREVADEMGVPPGLPVSPAVHDQYAATLGSGACLAGDLNFGSGTAWVLLAALDAFSEKMPSGTRVCPHIAPGLYGAMLSMVNGGSAFAWTLETLGLDKSGASEIEAMLAAAPPGCGGVRFHPLLVPGGSPGEAKNVPATLRNFRLGTGRAEILRACVEGLATELRRCLDMLIRGGFDAKRVVMTGAAGASRVTSGIIADTLQLPVATALESETTALGAAVVARAMDTQASDVRDISQAWARVGAEFAPSEHAVRCQAIYREYIEWLRSNRDG